MCISIPAQIKNIKGTIATVKRGSKKGILSIEIMPKLKVGDWVLSENGFAVYKITKKEAKESLNLIYNNL
ncbi:MAG: HypC/HybG/HupF family hydrogenase formation chaperone [bacterium]|nr:HypC/HybG/HupF family hydrogenase formation chaperone [bacterium]